ncbi:MAG: hypothetical protein H6657_30045 [Ardenticatenaceae bacterium]|nr:hypothetical protein [Ardenticatenaceae bacterium]
MSVADIITSISVAIAAISFVMGITAWKREFIGKRKIELAESLLAVFYEAEDAIKEIRSPFSYVGEGKTRKRSENELEEQSELLDRAYIVFERYQKREELFAQLRATKYRAMASFGAKASEPFDEIGKILKEIFLAANMLATQYWPRQGYRHLTEEQFLQNRGQMEHYEAIFWYMGEEKDEIGRRAHKAIKAIENIAREEIEGKVANRLRR